MQYSLDPKIKELIKKIRVTPELKTKYIDRFSKQLNIPEEKFDTNIEWYFSHFSDGDPFIKALCKEAGV